MSDHQTTDPNADDDPLRWMDGLTEANAGWRRALECERKLFGQLMLALGVMIGIAVTVVAHHFGVMT